MKDNYESPAIVTMAITSGKIFCSSPLNDATIQDYDVQTEIYW